MRQRARPHGLARGRVTIQTLYRGWGRLFYCNMAAIQATTRPPCATIRHLGLRNARQRVTRRARMALVLGVSPYNLRHDRPGLRHGRPSLRHGQARPLYGQGGGHDTAQRTPRHSAQRTLCTLPECSARDLCAQAGSGCAPGAPNLVLDSMHDSCHSMVIQNKKKIVS